MNIKIVIEIVACVIMLGGTIGIFIERIIQKRGIGIRVIQFLAVVLLAPMILILAIEGILNTQTTATLIGAIIGYILSGIGKDESK